MWRYVDDILKEFSNCFSRRASYRWFVIVIIGLMVSAEHLGVTSILRTVGVAPQLYESLIHFFRAESWRLGEIIWSWTRIVAKSDLVYRVNGMLVMIGDGVKASKEARKMPCVKKLAQESENSAKPNYIFGHLFGAIGILLGSAEKFFCAPLSMRIHDGNETIGEWAGDALAQDSHVVRLIKEACRIASYIEPSLLLLDRYYLSVPALQALAEAEKLAGHKLLTIVTKAKKSCSAFEKPPVYKGKGRPRIRGRKVKLQTLFDTCADAFSTTVVSMYGKRQKVSCLVKNLLWGETLYHELRFVLVVMEDGVKTILACTDTTMPPEAIIELYALRFNIENTFRELKQVVAGFAYRFWTLAMPKLNRFVKNDKMRERIEQITDDKQQDKIVSAMKAIEGFAMFSCIAIGILQMCSLRFAKDISGCAFRWLRTKRNQTPSEATTADYMRKTIFNGFYFSPDLDISRFILEAQTEIPHDAAA